MSNDLFNITFGQQVATTFKAQHQETYRALKNYQISTIKELRKYFYRETTKLLTKKVKEASSKGHTSFSISSDYMREIAITFDPRQLYPNVDSELLADELSDSLNQKFGIKNPKTNIKTKIGIYTQNSEITVDAKVGFSFMFPNAWSQAHFEHVNDFDYDGILDGDIQIHDSDPETRLLNNTGTKRFFNGSGLAINNGFNSVMHNPTNDEIIFDFTKED